ncbi:MAG: TonB-dependent receptor [Methylococcales bacterium]|nr:TonB-dependent receptor [Methylococcales bacterium]
MKTKISLAIASSLVIPLTAVAEYEQLPNIVVEGNVMRAGTFGTAPDSSGLKDTASLLKRVPGANVNRNGPLTGIASYRGMYGNRINISIDGANMKEVGPNSMDPPLSHIPAPLTGKLTVHRGIAPVSSGIESFGGSMHAESKKGRFAVGDGIETSGVASMGYGSVEDGHFGSLLGAVATDNHKLYLSGSKEQGRDYKIRNNQKQKNTRYDREAFTGGYAYQRDNHEFGINYSNNNTGHTGTPALPMDIVYVRGGLYDANYSWNLGDGYKLKTNIFYQKMRHLMSNTVMRNGGTPERDNVSNRTLVEAGGVDLAFSMPLFKGDFSVGINGDNSNHDALITRVGTSATDGGPKGGKTIKVNPFNDVERDRYSFFTEWAGEINEDLFLELGARYTHTWMNAGEVSGPKPMAKAIAAFNNVDRKRNFNEVDITTVLRYSASDELDIEFGFGRKNRAPTYQELYLFTNLSAVGGLADGNTYISDLGLEHETAYQFDIAFDWHNDNAYISPRFFYHYVDDYIQGERTLKAQARGKNILQFTNIQAQLFGVDLEAGYSFNENWRFDAGLNYVRGLRVNSPTDDNDLYRIAPLNGRAQVTYEQSGWMGAIEGVFYADQGNVIGFRDNIGDEQKTKGYMLLNLRGKYEPYSGIVIGTGIENVLDSKHYDHLGGYENHKRTNGRVAMPGRNIYATLSYNW